MNENSVTPSSSKPPGLARRIFRSPLMRIGVLGYLLLMMMGLNGDVMTSYAGEPAKSVQHIVALAIAGFAVYRAYAIFIEQRAVSELAVPGMGRELGIGLLIGAGLYATCELILMAMGFYRIDGLNPASFMIPAIAMRSVRESSRSCCSAGFFTDRSRPGSAVGRPSWCLRSCSA